MGGLKTIVFLMLLCGTLPSLFADCGVLAEIDGVPLNRESLCQESKNLLPDVSLAPDVREVKIRAAVLTELKIRETIAILKQENIACTPEVAKWYIAERKKKYPTAGKDFETGLLKLVNDRRFQLKSAIYKYLSIRNPEKVRLSAGEAEAYYFRNQLKYRINVPGVYKLIELPTEGNIASDIRSSLLQGESAERVAERFGVKFTLSAPEQALVLSRLKLRENAVSEVISLNGKSWIAVCAAEEKNSFIPFKQVLEPLIEEELISRRAGAAFDEILKARLSQKNIKYRR